MRVACLLLCAGQSRRMEGGNKLLMKVGGKSLVRWVAERVATAGFSEIVAVTGHQKDEVAQELSPLGIPLVHNSHYHKGMHSSIRTGLEALQEEPDFFAVCLGDQPFLTSKDYERLIQSTTIFPQAPLIVPYFAGVQGNPVLIASHLRPQILQRPDDDRGCHYLLKTYHDRIVPIEMPTDSALLDVDTRQALEHTTNSLQALDEERTCTRVSQASLT